MFCWTFAHPLRSFLVRSQYFPLHFSHYLCLCPTFADNPDDLDHYTFFLYIRLRLSPAYDFFSQVHRTVPTVCSKFYVQGHRTFPTVRFEIKYKITRSNSTYSTTTHHLRYYLHHTSVHQSRLSICVPVDIPRFFAQALLCCGLFGCAGFCC